LALLLLMRSVYEVQKLPPDKFDNKFLDKVKALALDHKNEPVPYGREDLYQAMMWTHGVIAALKSEGFIIEKKKEK
jgi:hypothetical protein